MSLSINMIVVVKTKRGGETKFIQESFLTMAEFSRFLAYVNLLMILISLYFISSVHGG